MIRASTRENLSSGVGEQHRRRTACAFSQSDQRLCYLLFGKYHVNLLQGEISIFELVFVAEETGLKLAFFFETPKTGTIRCQGCMSSFWPA